MRLLPKARSFAAALAVGTCLVLLRAEAAAPTATQKDHLLRRERTQERLARWKFGRGQYAEARAAFQEVLAARLKLYGEGHFSVADARLDLANVALYERLGKEDRDRLDEAARLVARAAQLNRQGKAREAFPLTRRAYEIRKAVFGADHPRTADLLNNLGSLLRDQAKYREARPYLEQSLAIFRKALGENHPSTALAHNNLGLLLHDQGDFPAARLHYEQALAVFRAAYGDAHLRTALAHNNLGSLLRELGEYRAALAHLDRALAIYEKLRGKDHADTARALDNRGVVRQTLGDYQGSRADHERALAVRRKVLGGDHYETAVSCTNLGDLLRVQGDYRTARVYYEKSLAVHKKVLGDRHPSTATALSNLGVLLQAQGDYAAALPYFVQALEVDRRALGDRHPDTATALALLASLLQDQGAYAAARPYYERALDILRAVRGPRHPRTATALINLGSLLQAQGDFAAAQARFAEALAIDRAALGDRHPATAAALLWLGLSFKVQGQPAAASKAYEEALAIDRAVLGDDHPTTATAYNNLGSLRQAQGDLDAARACYAKVLDARLKFARELVGTLSEAEALAYVEATQLGRDPLLSVLRKSSRVEEAYRAVWETRGLVSRALLGRRPPDEDPRARDLWTELRGIRAELARLTLAVVPPDRAALRRKRLTELARAKEDLERRLAAVSESFRRRQRLDGIGFADLAARLPARTAVLDVVRTILFEQPADGKGRSRGTLHYEAFVLRRSDRAPGYALAWVHLGPAKPIDEAVRAWRQSLLATGAASSRADARAKDLRRLVWQPVEPHLAGCSAVVIIPDAGLTAVPWAALPGTRPGSYLLEDYTLSTAVSGRQLYSRLARAPSSGGQVLVVGGVRYDAAPPRGTAPGPAALRGPALAARPGWPYLKGTAQEAEQIAALWSGPGAVRLLEGARAGEAAVREQLPHARYVHLATHGFFADPQFRSALRHDLDGERLSLDGVALFGRRSTVTGRNPLILSGVVLAGANLPRPLSAEGIPVGDDGVLTAEEVAELDLGRTELVVLSACETGLGEVAGGEGIFGLQRAFGLAGARTVAASLWKVDDAATQRLMAHFYDNLWRRHMGPAAALRHAQLSLLRGPGTRSVERGRVVTDDGAVEKSSGRLHPRLWAAWVVSGDPGEPGPDLPAAEESAESGPAEGTPGGGSGTTWIVAGVLLGLGVVGGLTWRVRRRRRP